MEEEEAARSQQQQQQQRKHRGFDMGLEQRRNAPRLRFLHSLPSVRRTLVVSELRPAQIAFKNIVIDLQAESGEYFSSEKKKTAKKWEEKQEKQESSAHASDSAKSDNVKSEASDVAASLK
ncbi:uncharacterized protein A4U43_C08F1650, partial [Asparagus officinalis]